MKKKIVAIFTSSFPYPAGEQFIEAEIAYWSGLSWAKVVVCPLFSNGQARAIPDDIEIFRGDNPTIARLMLFALRGVFSAIFFRELGFLLKNKQLNFLNILYALHSVALAFFIKKRGKSLVRKYGQIDVAYSYWNTEQAYGLCLLKRENAGVSRVVSRAHGYDLYEYRRKNNYMPLKRQFQKDFDALYAISEQGRQYLNRTYGFHAATTKKRLLGVAVPKQLSVASTDNVVRLVSVSFCTKVKRVDRIINALKIAAEKDTGRNFEWVHIGDGPLLTALRAKAEESLGKLPNVNYRFLGALTNSKVLDFFVDNPVDIFINCSEYEGIPVSIMEAMAHGVPAMAPAVGGIPELIDNDCGILLSTVPTENEMASGITQLLDRSKEYRLNARNKIIKNFNAHENFSSFVGEIKNMAFLDVDAESI